MVEVERPPGVTAADVLELVRWTESFGVYVPVTVKLAVVDGVKVTEQLPANRVHGFVPVITPVPVVIAKLTVPAGTLAPRPAVSVTVAVQVEP